MLLFFCLFLRPPYGFNNIWSPPQNIWKWSWGCVPCVRILIGQRCCNKCYAFCFDFSRKSYYFFPTLPVVFRSPRSQIGAIFSQKKLIWKNFWLFFAFKYWLGQRTARVSFLIIFFRYLISFVSNAMGWIFFINILRDSFFCEWLFHKKINDCVPCISKSKMKKVKKKRICRIFSRQAKSYIKFLIGWTKMQKVANNLS